MKKHELIQFLYDNKFIEYDDIYAKVEESGIQLLDKEIYIFKDEKRIVIMKAYESFKTAYRNYEEIQNKIKIIIGLLKTKYRKNVYYFICVNEILAEKYIKIINLIEKDQYICKKYVIINDTDFRRISFLMERTSDEDLKGYNDIQVDDLFFNLIKRYCKDEDTVYYAKDYLENRKRQLDEEE